MTLRSFEVWLNNVRIDTVHFIGEEYTESTVKSFLIEIDKMSRDIEVRQIKEIIK